MSVLRLPLGWDVCQAVEAKRDGRLVLIGGGNWGWDVRPGYPCWGWNQNTVTYHEDISRAILQWLTRKSSGMNILLWRYEATSANWGDIGFKGFCERSGTADVTWYTGTFTGGVGLNSTVTVTNTGYSFTEWTLNAWRGSDGVNYNPNDYDVVILGYMPNPDYQMPGIDAYLANGGAIWTPQSSTNNADAWNNYGLGHVSGFQTGGGVPDYMCPEFACSPLGAANYRYGIFSTVWVSTMTNTMGGTSRTYPDNDATDRIGLWSSN